METRGFYMGSEPRLYVTAWGDRRLQALLDDAEGSESEAVGADSRSAGRAILLAHWLPTGPWDDESEELLDSLASKLSSITGVGVLAPRMRGIGPSEGDFSISGWCRDMAAAVDYLSRALGGETNCEIFGIGFGIGGSCLLSLAAGDVRFRGVAAAGSPAEFANLSLAHDGYIKKARTAGLIRSESFPPDPYLWRRELIAYAPLHHARRLAGRPVLLICRDSDKVASPLGAYRIAEAIGASCEVQSISLPSSVALHKSDKVVERIGAWIKRQLGVSEKANAAV